MKAKFSSLVRLFALVGVSSILAFAQSPTRIYGPTANEAMYTIRNINNHCTGFGLDHIRFGDWLADSWLYGFMQWTFTQGTLPPEVTSISQVELKFRVRREGSNYYTQHASFTLYDVKLPIYSDPDALHQALSSENQIIDGTTTTENGAEVYTLTQTSGNLVNAVLLALTSRRNYITLGVKRIPEQGQGGENWDIADGYGGTTATLKVWFSAPQYTVQFRNDLDEASYGAITATDHNGVPTQISSGATLPLYWGDQTTVTAYSGRYQYNTNNWKYQSWTNGQPNDNQNPKTFAVNDARAITAYFKPVYDVTVRNDLEGLEAGQLTYQGNPVSTGYTEQDVFRYTPRTFGAITPQSYSGLSFAFYQWNDGSVSPTRDVSVSSTQTYQARYKGHLASSLSSASGPTTQRRLVRDESGTYHLVYHSLNKIWYSQSSDAGVTWTQDLELLPWVSQNPKSFPAIATHRNRVFVVWQEYEGQDTAQMHVYLIRGAWKPLGGSWNLILKGGLEPILARFPIQTDPTPVIVAAENTYNERTLDPELMLAWRGPDGIYSAVGNRDNITGGEQEEDPLTEVYVWNQNVRFGRIAGTWSGCKYPSLATNLQSRVTLSYLDDEDLMLYFVCSNDGAGWYGGYPSASLDPLGIPQSGVSTAIDGTGRLHFSWITLDPYREYDRVVMHRSRTLQGSWSPYYEIIDDYGVHEVMHTSVCAHADAIDGGVSILWTDNSGGVFDYFLPNGTSFGGWKYHPMGAHTSYPNAISQGAPTQVSFLATQNPSAPFRIGFGMNDDNTIGRTEEEEPTMGVEESPSRLLRKIVLEDTSSSSSISIQFGDTKLLGTRDTLNRQLRFRRGGEETHGTFLRTATLGNPGVKRIQLRLQADGQGPRRGFSAALNLVDSVSGYIISQLESVDIPARKNVKLRKTINAEIPPVSGLQNAFLELVLVDAPWSDCKKALVNVVEVGNGNQGVKASALAKRSNTSQSALPTEWVLHENYPNPFNPSTQINFDLPEAANVSLVIYDVLGRKVAELVNGQVEAGYRSVTWNAVNAASGVYFARFTATDASGNVKLTKVNKLMLMK